MADPNWDQTKFDQALDLYLTVCSRERTDAINSKAFFIARKSLWFTTKTSEDRIITELMELVTVTSQQGNVSRTAQVPLSVAIVQSRRGKRNEPGLYSSELVKAVGALFRLRLRSRAFLASGWLPAIKTLSPVAKDKSKTFPTDNSVKRIGAATGSATIANDASLAVATIINSATAKHDKKDALTRYGGPALNEAFADETADIYEYIDRKLAPATAQANKELG